MQQEEPFEDFEEQIRSIHWEQVGTKLTTPSMVAALLPDGRLILKRGDKVFGLEHSDVEALTRFLGQYAQVEPLAPPEEPEWFKNFTPTPVTVDMDLPPTDARLDPSYKPMENDIYLVSFSEGNYNVSVFTNGEWEELPTFLPAHAAKVLASRMQFLGSTENYRQYYRPIDQEESE